jgi:hypothetical protein
MKKLGRFIVLYILAPAIFIVLFLMIPWLLICQCISSKTVRGIAFMVYLGLGQVLLVVLGSSSYFGPRRSFGNRLWPYWLTVTTEKAWDPDWTYIDSGFEPVVRFLEDERRWRIEFICSEESRQHAEKWQVQWRLQRWRSFWKWR